MRCPVCESTEVLEQHTSALGRRLYEVRCKNCGKYDAFFEDEPAAGRWFGRPQPVGAEPEAPAVVEVAPLEWIEIPGGSYDLGLTEEEARRLAEMCAAMARWQHEVDPDPLHGFREAAEVEQRTGNVEFLLSQLAAVQPAHRIELAPYAIASRPVSNREYLEFLEHEGCARPTAWDEGVTPPLDEAVRGVAWIDAQAFADWAGLALPTEAQWERAAGGGERRLFPWGDAFEPQGSAIVWSEPIVAGARPEIATPDGIHELLSGLFEWCSGAFEAYPGADPNAQRRIEPPLVPDPAKRVRRGGVSNLFVPCAALRGGAEPGSRLKDTTFRCTRPR